MSIKVKRWLFQFVQNVIKFDYIEDRISLKIKKIHIHLYFTVLVKLCPYERYRQLSLKRFLILAGNIKVGNPRLCCFFFKTQHRFLH